MIRVPAKRGPSTRIELRSPDPSCNPYLALADVILRAGLEGIRQGLEPRRRSTRTCRMPARSTGDSTACPAPWPRQSVLWKPTP